ncbi:MAG: purine-nucleoside phosphorylase [Gemmatimonadales bacterium]|jgi:purine-nucleoside phosphorylase|nr:MAG: purine-nucleoside phosphorylase [Gemmatimonadales bacterium]
MTASLDATVAAVHSRMGTRAPKVAIVLGSGLGGLADRLTDAVRIPYAEIPGFHIPTVQGHSGELVVGTLAGQAVVVQSGRFHLYEGHAADVTALPARLFGELGVTTLVVTNAAGGVRASFGPGTLMLITDHLNLTGRNPLAGPVVAGELRFPDMSAAYDPALRALALDVAREQGTELQQGVYAALLGPSYETPAEIRMLRTLGADAVGMSTVPEVIVASARGMRCLGISTVTNAAAGVSEAKLSHAEVMATAGQVGQRLGDLIEGIVARI